MSDSIAFGGLAFRRRSDFISGRGRPIISGLNYSQGDTVGGGESIIFTGLSFSDVTSVKFGTASASITSKSSKSITVTLPASPYTIANFDGTNDILVPGGTADTYFNNQSFSGWILFRANAVSTNDVTSYGNVCLISTAPSAYFLIYLRSNGEIGARFVTSGEAIATSTFTVGAWTLVQWKYDGSNIKIRVNDGAWQSTTQTGNFGDLTSTLRLGNNYNSSTIFKGQILEVGLSDEVLSDGTFDNIAAGLVQDYGLTIGSVVAASYDRSVLSLTAWWKPGNYSAGTWSGEISAGISGNNDATEATNYPAVSRAGGPVSITLQSPNATTTTSFTYWDPTMDNTTRVVWDSLHTAYENTGNTWTPRFVSPRVNGTYTGLVECINSGDSTVTPAPTITNGAPTFPGDGTAYGLRTKTSSLQWLDVLGASAADNTEPGTIVLVQEYLNDSGSWSGTNAYNNDAFIGEHSGGTIGLGGAYDGTTPIISGHVWHPTEGYKTIKVTVTSHGNKMMVFSRFGANGSANFGVGVNGDTSGSTYSETVHTGGAYTAGAGNVYTGYGIDFGYRYPGSADKIYQTTNGILYTAIIQDARASDALITKMYNWTRQRFGVVA